jgi:N-acetyl-anhydromuramyl-L-alanine amidase AmpD
MRARNRIAPSAVMLWSRRAWQEGTDHFRRETALNWKRVSSELEKSNMVRFRRQIRALMTL